MLERTRVARREKETAQIDCRAPRHTIRQVTTITTFFLESFCLFPTSERVNISAIIVTTEVHELFANLGAYTIPL